MRKYKLEKTINGKAYTNELRQFIANQVDLELNRSNDNIKTIWEMLGNQYSLAWTTVRNYHNALGNSPVLDKDVQIEQTCFLSLLVNTQKNFEAKL